MAQTTPSKRPLAAPSYDPETDPILAQMRRHGSSGGGRKALVAVGVVGLVIVVGWYAYSRYDSRVAPAGVEIEEAIQPQVAPEPAPPLSPLERAENWQAEHLSSTEFAGLPVAEGEDGAFFLLYTAHSGDSFGSVVTRYVAHFEPGATARFVQLARRQHVNRYGGRRLWAGDEIRLLLPPA